MENAIRTIIQLLSAHRPPDDCGNRFIAIKSYALKTTLIW